jgi:hypothetical protein
MGRREGASGLSAVAAVVSRAARALGRASRTAGLRVMAGAGRPSKTSYPRAPVFTSGPAPPVPEPTAQRFPLGTLLNGTLLSTRMSPGRPSTRSAMMLRKISSEPPAMRELGEDSRAAWNIP